MIIFWQEDKERKGNFDIQRKGLLLEIPNNNYTRHFKAVTSDINDGPAVVRSYVSCPKRGESYNVSANEKDLLATCVKVDVEPTDSPFVFYVTAEYSTDRLVSLTFDNPLNMPAELNWGSAPYERPMFRDYFGVPVVNSSRERYDPPIMSEEKRPVLTIRRNESTYNALNALLYEDSVNAAPVTFDGLTAQPGYAKINSITSTKQADLATQYRQLTYEIEFRREGFWFFALDLGWKDIDGNLFRDVLTRAPLSNPSLMNGRGRSILMAKTKLAMNIGNGTVLVGVQDASNFPPGPKVGTAHWYYDIKVDDEIMTVIDGFGTTTWGILRAQRGTFMNDHASGSDVTLEPYYMRYMPYRSLDWGNLNLPSN
jgi:hypothetical protein